MLFLLTFTLRHFVKKSHLFNQLVYTNSPARILAQIIPPLFRITFFRNIFSLF